MILKRLLCLILLLIAIAGPASAEAETARFDLGASSIEGKGRAWWRFRGPEAYDIQIASSAAVPYRVFFLDGPPRLIVDFNGLDFGTTAPSQLRGGDLVKAVRWGHFRSDWSRMVVELPGPYALSEAIQTPTETGSRTRLQIKPVKQADFVVRTDALTALWDLPESAVPPAKPKAIDPNRKPRIAIDPGHGGIDPGAQVGAISEAAVMLGFATELMEALKQAGYEVVATRTDDSFVPLERRMTIARAQNADLMISLHADALPEGQAAGATIYVWDEAANDRAAVELATRHDRSDLLAGVDLADTDDEVAQVLMDLARTDTHPRTRNFAGMLVSEMSRGGFDMHRRPVRGAAFSVLKSPDIPSILLELGFLTDPNDRANLFDPDWRRRMAESITRAINAWHEDELTRAALLRK